MKVYNRILELTLDERCFAVDKHNVTRSRTRVRRNRELIPIYTVLQHTLV
jgi:hypothetical protein